MLKLVTWVGVLVTTWIASSVQGTHWKAHGTIHNNDDHHHHHHHHHHHQSKNQHDKKILSDVGMDAPKYLQENFGQIYAVCVFDHNGWVLNDFSVGFFDQQGNLLETVCKETSKVDMEDIGKVSKNPDGWTTERIDSQSVCYIHGNEAVQDASKLMGSYNCK